MWHSHELTDMQKFEVKFQQPKYNITLKGTYTLTIPFFPSKAQAISITNIITGKNCKNSCNYFHKCQKGILH